MPTDNKITFDMLIKALIELSKLENKGEQNETNE